jgi:hypothetical protein
MVTEVFYLYRNEATGRWGAKMPWVPLHLRDGYPAARDEVPGVTVRVASLEKPSEMKTRKFSAVASFRGLGGAHTSFVALPGEGPWRIVATSGPDWGCFDLRRSTDIRVETADGVFHGPVRGLIGRAHGLYSPGYAIKKIRPRFLRRGSSERVCFCVLCPSSPVEWSPTT